MDNESPTREGYEVEQAGDAEDTLGPAPKRISTMGKVVIFFAILLLLSFAAVAAILLACSGPSPQERMLDEIEADLASGACDDALAGLREMAMNYPDCEETGAAKEIYFAHMAGLVEKDLEALDLVSAQEKLGFLEGVFFDSVYSTRIEELRSLYKETEWLAARCALASTLDGMRAEYPPQMIDLLEGIDYELTEYDLEVTCGTALSVSIPSHNRIGLITPQIFEEDITSVVFHEWGHFVDYHLLDDRERAAYRAMRGIPGDIPWKLEDSGMATQHEYLSCPAEDFAEVFRVVVGGCEWHDGSVYGVVTDPSKIKEWIINVASN